MAHPSYVTDEELVAFEGPISIAACEKDGMLTKEKRYHAEDILNREGRNYQINLYCRVSHGFSVHGDMTNPVERYAKEQAFLQAVTWFDNWLL